MPQQAQQTDDIGVIVSGDAAQVACTAAAQTNESCVYTPLPHTGPDALPGAQR